jgi:hypothetical protein
MKKQRMWDNVEYIAEIKISSISLSLRANLRGNKRDISYHIGDSKFRFREAMMKRANLKL